MGQHCDGTLNRSPVRLKPNDGRRVIYRDLAEGADHVVTVQPKRNAVVLAIREDCPRELILWREILGYGNGEHSIPPAREEMRRLTHVGAARLDTVIGPDRDVKLLFGVAIEVSDQKGAGIFVAGEPPLECARNAGAELLPWLGYSLATQEHAANETAGGANSRQSVHCNFCPVTACAICPLR